MDAMISCRSNSSGSPVGLSFASSVMICVEYDAGQVLTSLHVDRADMFPRGCVRLGRRDSRSDCRQCRRAAGSPYFLIRITDALFVF